MAGILLKLKTWWETSDRTQKMMTFGGAGFLIVLLFGTFIYASTPKMALLFGGLSESDKAAVVAEVNLMGIPVNYSVPGQVEVPQNKVEDVRMRLATANKLPKSAHMGIADLDKLSLLVTPAQERERLKAILEGELAKSIETLEGVTAARVHLTMQDPSPFLEQKRPASASINIREKSGTRLSSQQGRAIATLVSNASPGMDVKNVTVVNQNGEFVYNGQESDTTATIADTKLALEEKVAKEREKELQSKLDRIYGPGITVVTVHAEIDLDKEKQTTHTVDAKKPVAQNSVKETMPVFGTAAASPAGLTGNLNGPQATQTQQASQGTYTATSQSNVVPMSEKTTDTEKATGSLKSMTINVMANSDPNPDLIAPITAPKPGDTPPTATNKLSIVAEQAQLVAFLKGEVTALKARDQAAFPDPTVTFINFDKSSAQRAEAAKKDMDGVNSKQQIISMLPIAALLLVAFMVVRQVGKYSRTITVNQSGLPASIGAHNDHGPHGPGNGATFGNAAKPLDGQSQEMQNVLLNALDNTPSGPALPDFVVEAIPDKLNMPLEQLKKMAKERPHAVAMLIRSMLLEEKK